MSQVFYHANNGMNYVVGLSIPEIPGELVAYDTWIPSTTISHLNRTHALSPCGNCGRVKAAHINWFTKNRSPRGLDGLDGVVPQLTDAERKVLAELVKGATVPQTAEKFVVSEGTIRSHKVSIYRKLQVHTRVELLNRARALGLYDG